MREIPVKKTIDLTRKLVPLKLGEKRVALDDPCIPGMRLESDEELRARAKAVFEALLA